MEEKKTNKYRCLVCGYEVELENLPKDYVCPICGATSDNFELIDEE